MAVGQLDVSTPFDPLVKERDSAHWREIEKVVADVLQRLTNDAVISGFVRWTDARDTPEGADFVVVCQVDGVLQRRSLGVTTSAISRNARAARFRGVTTHQFPVETRPEKIRNRILTLFSSSGS